jgi:hypothetical protein
MWLKSDMRANHRIVQDLADILHINRERSDVFSNAAYRCERIPLKMLLNQEADNSGDSAIGIERLLVAHYEIEFKPKPAGHIYMMWSEFKPSFLEPELSIQLKHYEIADVLTILFYQSIINRDYVDSISKSLLEFQYQFHLNIYRNLKSFQLSLLEPEKRNDRVIGRNSNDVQTTNQER